MREYEAINKPLTLSHGVVELTEQQAIARAHNLSRTTKTGKKYEIINPIQFKVGERFGYESELPKALAEDVEQVAAEAEAEAKAKAEAEAKAKAEAEAKAKAEAEAKAKAEAEAKAKAEAEAKAKAEAEANNAQGND